MNERILIIGGDWDLKGGKPSGFVRKFKDEMSKYTNNITYYNGGNYNDVESILNTASEYNVVFWFLHVDNSLPKVRDIKRINPHIIYVGSKRNDDNKYPFVEVLNRSLMERHNLTIQFSKEGDIFKTMLFDPLGTMWYDGTDISKLVEHSYKRISFLLTMRREHTFSSNQENTVPSNPEFIEYVHEAADTFHESIEHTEGVTRFMGNASFRGKDEKIYVSKRDADKSEIDSDNFITCYLKDNKLYYDGDNKPSKDAVVQAHLYKLFPNINYIIHSHCYAEGGFYTTIPVPCGSLNELDEIFDVVKRYYGDRYDLPYYKINYLGHGCLLLARNIEDLKRTSFVKRHLPEKLPAPEIFLDKGMYMIKK